jgi:Nucleoporin complex subunit 54
MSEIRYSIISITSLTLHKSIFTVGLPTLRTNPYGRRQFVRTLTQAGMLLGFDWSCLLLTPWWIRILSLVPVLGTGFDDLQKRVEAQTQQATAHQEKLKEIRARVEKLSERHVLTNAPRLQKLASAQSQLTHRLLRLVQHLHLLIPALRSSSIRPEEEALRAALEEVDGEIRRPGGMGRIVGKLNELWALVGAVNAMRGANSKGSTDGVEWAVVDEEGLNQIVQVWCSASHRHDQGN